MNVWLWILQRSPISTSFWISTNVPTREPAPIRQPYRLVNGCTTTSAPNSTSLMRRNGASFAGALGIGEVRADRVGDGGELTLLDSRVDRQRQPLGRKT